LLFGLLMDRGALSAVWPVRAALQPLLVAAAFNVGRGSRPADALAAG